MVSFTLSYQNVDLAALPQVTWMRPPTALQVGLQALLVLVRWTRLTLCFNRG